MKKINILAIFVLCSTIQILSSDSSLDRKIKRINERAHEKIDALRKKTNTEIEALRENAERAVILSQREQSQAAQNKQERHERFESIIQKHPGNTCCQYYEVGKELICCSAASLILGVAAISLPEDKLISSPGIYGIRLDGKKGLAMGGILGFFVGIDQTVQNISQLEKYKETRRAPQPETMQ